MGGRESAIAASENWFIGEDRTFVFDIYQENDTTAQVMTGWTLKFELLTRRLNGSIVLTKSSGTPSEMTIGNGVGVNSRATVFIDDTDTEGLDEAAGTYWYELRRTDAGSETVLAFGSAVLQQGAIPPSS